MYEDLDVDLSSYFTNVGSPLATFDLPCKSKSSALNFRFYSIAGVAECCVFLNEEGHEKN